MKGKRVKFTAIIIADVVDGKITSLHEVFDSAAVMAQLGPAVPAGASTSDLSP